MPTETSENVPASQIEKLLDEVYLTIRNHRRIKGRSPKALFVSREMADWLAMHAGKKGYVVAIELSVAPSRHHEGRLFGVPYRVDEQMTTPIEIVYAD